MQTKFFICKRFVLNFHRECWNPMKSHSKALVFFAVSARIPVVYSADRGRAEKISIVSRNRLKHLSMRYVSATKVVVELAR